MAGLRAPGVLCSGGTAAQGPHAGSSLGPLEGDLWQALQGRGWCGPRVGGLLLL